MNFPEKAINMIEKFMLMPFRMPMINNIKLLGFPVTSGVPQNFSLSGVLFNASMILLIAKNKCLLLHTRVRPCPLHSQKC